MAARNTVQRALIVDAVRSLADHPTAEEVFETVCAAHPSIGKATVYRTLNRLSDEGVIGHVRINNGADRFDYRTDEHYHVRCVRCGRVDDVEISPLEGLDEEASHAGAYRICGHTLQFDGICPDCQALEASTAERPSA